MHASAAALLAALAILLGTSVWLDQSLIGPVVGPDSVAFHFCSASPAQLASNIAMAAGALVICHFIVDRSLLRRTEPRRVRLSDVSYLAPLSLAAVNLLGVGVLDERLRDVWAPVAYIAMDLRWPMAMAGVGLLVVALRTHQRRAQPRESAARTADPRPLITDMLLAGAVMAFAIVTTPQIRFTALTTGDEPKYIRFAENWFQGKGMQIDRFVNVSELSAEENRPNLLRNLTYIAPAVRENIASAADDLATLRDPANWTRRFNRAESADNHVVRGKNGWHYQIHGPGLSALLLPAYLVDRTLFDSGTSMFADDMFTTSMVMLLIYGALATLTYRMALAAGARQKIALVSSAILILSLPIAAMPFQFYPETTAGVLTSIVVLRILQGGAMTHRAAIGLALALTFLGWLHIRFLLIAGIALVWLLWSFRSTNRAVLATLLAWFAGGMVTLCLYAYHVTGSLLPSAPFALGVGSGFVWDRVPVGLFAMLLDRMYGLLPLAPVYILGIAGLGLMARRQPLNLAVIATIAMGLIVPSAGQGYYTDGSVPLRHALAVLPLGAIPIALWLDSRGRRPLTAVVALLLIALSIRTAVAYNLQNDKTVTTMLDAAFSGWDISLLFPMMQRIRTNPITIDAWLMIFAVASVVGVFAFGALSSDDTPGQTVLGYARAFAFVSLTFALVGSLWILAGGPAHRWELLRGYRPVVSGLSSCWIEIGAPPPRRY